jgi:hypothetical protein
MIRHHPFITLQPSDEQYWETECTMYNNNIDREIRLEEDDIKVWYQHMIPTDSQYDELGILPPAGTKDECFGYISKNLLHTNFPHNILQPEFNLLLEIK